MDGIFSWHLAVFFICEQKLAGGHEINLTWQKISLNDPVLLVEGRVIKVEDGRSEKLTLPHDGFVVAELNDLPHRRLSRLQSVGYDRSFCSLPPWYQMTVGTSGLGQ